MGGFYLQKLPRFLLYDDSLHPEFLTNFIFLKFQCNTETSPNSHILKLERNALLNIALSEIKEVTVQPYTIIELS